MTKPELPDCRVCSHYSNCDIWRSLADHRHCVNGSEFKQSPPIRLYEIDEVKDGA